MKRRAFALYDRRDGKRGQMSSYLTHEQAEEAIAYYRRRDAAGGRPDIHDFIPHLAVVELTEETWGSQPGDVIATPDSAVVVTIGPEHNGVRGVAYGLRPFPFRPIEQGVQESERGEH